MSSKKHRPQSGRPNKKAGGTTGKNFRASRLPESANSYRGKGARVGHSIPMPRKKEKNKKKKKGPCRTGGRGRRQEIPGIRLTEEGRQVEKISTEEVAIHPSSSVSMEEREPAQGG